MAEELCAFCLGGNTEVPPFGTLKDARDLIYPCSTCTLVVHRKCLVDWFNNVPHKHVTRGNAPVSAIETADTAEIAEAPENEDSFDWFLRFNFSSVLGQYQTNGAETSENTAADHSRRMHTEESRASAGQELLSTPCPQCKSEITFEVQPSRLLRLKVWIRNTAVDTVQYSTILLGLTGAATGVLTMGYVGLVRSGIAIVDTLVPVSLISPIFYRNPSFAQSRSLSASLNGSGSGMDPYFAANQLKLQHITLLPIMLYRMRYSSILDYFFRSKPRVSITEWVSEALLCNYISSVGNHILVKQLYKNAAALLAKSATNKLELFKLGLLFKNVDWWNPSVMVALTIPARWAYEFVYRMTSNRLFFDLNASVRPLEIANKLNPEHLDRLETLKTQEAGVKCNISKRLDQSKLSSRKQGHPYFYGLVREIASLFHDRTFYKYIRLKVLYWYHKSKACIQNDYSTSLLGRPVAFTGVTTFLWPFISAHLGKLIYGIWISKVPAFANIEKDKLIFLSNLLGMALVALLKDTVNVFFCYEGVQQLWNLKVVTEKEKSSVPSHKQTTTIATPRIPGAFEH